MEQQEKYYLLSESQLNKLLDKVSDAMIDAPYPDLPEALSIPSDEEIESEYTHDSMMSDRMYYEQSAKIDGAKWMKDKILNQTKKLIT